MRRDVRSPGLAGHRSLLPKRRDGSRFRLTMLVVCCMAAVGLTIPAVSVTGRLLASSGSTAGRPSSAGSILAAGASSARGAVTNPAVAASALAASTSTAPTDCADVLFVGARGSGEPGPGDRGWEPTKDDPYGLGATIESARQRLVADLGTNRTMQTESVSYVANGVQTILHAPNQYFANLNVGVTWTLGVLGGEARNCPAQQIVLAGFSQGAMVMHRVLHDLTNSKTASDRALLARVAAAILVGDGDQVPYDNEVLDGTAGAGAKGIGHLYPSISHTSNAKFPQSLGVKVQRVCYRHDPVCDVTEAELNPIAFHIHTSYPGGASLLGAADQAALDVRNMPAPRALTITAPVDTALSYQLSADIASGSTLQWRLAAGAKLAPGLTLSRTGLMTGTPTTVGTYSTPVQVRAVHAKTAGPWLPATLTVTVTSASSTSSGGSWAATEAPVPGDGSPSPSITSMSCASASSCAAIGDYKNSEGDASMLLTRLGGSWTTSLVPLPAGISANQAIAKSVSCGSPSYCVAVGGYYTPDTGALILTWTGGSWQATQPPLPGNAEDAASASLDGVSCPSASYCVAVGSYTDTSGLGEGLLLTWSGGSWSAAAAPLPDNVVGQGTDIEHGELHAVSCASSSSCVAVGSYTDTSRAFQGLLLTMSKGSWTAAEAALPGNAAGNPYVQLKKLSCDSAAACVAEGTYQDASNKSDTLLLTWSGGSWESAQTPLPADASSDTSVTITGLSCASASLCFAVGSYNGSGSGGGLLLTWANGSWSVTQDPLPDDASTPQAAGLEGISCPSSIFCVAVGSYEAAKSGYTGTWAQGLLLTWLNGAWKAETSPQPENAVSPPHGNTQVDAVSCVSSVSCTAGGFYLYFNVTGYVSAGLLLNMSG